MAIFLAPIHYIRALLFVFAVEPLLVTASSHHKASAHEGIRARRNALASPALLPGTGLPKATGYAEFLVETTMEVTGTTQLFNLSDLTMFSTDCATALAATLDCSSGIRAQSLEYGLTENDLDELCTSGCSGSIATMRDSVISNCANDIYTDAPSNATGYVYGTGISDDIYNVEGVANPSTFCYTLRTNGTSNGAEVNECGDCGLGIIRMQLENPMGYIDELASQYSSSASSCGVTVAPIPTPTPVFMSDQNTFIANYSKTQTCTGSYVPIPTGSTCDDFAESNSVATDQLLSVNGLAGGCANWPADLIELCVQNTCEPYLVQQNDTCLGVASSFNLTLTQLLSWNLAIDPFCANWDNEKGHIICVSNSVGYVEADIGSTTTVDTAASVPTNIGPGSNTNCAQWYNVTEADTSCAQISMQFGITLSDFNLLNPEIVANCTNLWLGEYRLLRHRATISKRRLTVIADSSYCVQAVGDISTYSGYGGTTTTSMATFTADPSMTWDSLPSATKPSYKNITTTTASYPLASGSLTGCFEMFENNFGPIPCYQAASLFGVDTINWVRWNPSVLNGQNYTMTGCKLTNETEYCGSFYNQSSVPATTLPYVPAPINSTANATTECYDWYGTEDGDSCDLICRANNIPVSALYKWNPAVEFLGADCTNLWMQASYCVQGPGWEDVAYNQTSSVTSTTTTGEWYIAMANDTCLGITKEYSISQAQFYAWNPAIGEDCTDLEIDDAYCVKAPTTISTTTTSSVASQTSTGTSITPPGPTQADIPSNCDAYALAQTDDGCQTFADRNKITLTNLYKWNPALNNACENFWAKEAYCIGVSS
ncbi:uncharacterized protein N7484_008228 [Penicillium longicatenatum]|uniref:uncharacterized protein n=1 Tax=Penicillium longicatenatum TaxID=1561947 RepID=UPI0025492410|nr:uncharacterized protein N7484_008228 [Penicillium longicatenatum]KAJ5640366.1 hypothetical protein N7484_008228 [Penicillium longicatenatum]